MSGIDELLLNEGEDAALTLRALGHRLGIVDDEAAVHIWRARWLQRSQALADRRVWLEYGGAEAVRRDCVRVTRAVEPQRTRGPRWCAHFTGAPGAREVLIDFDARDLAAAEREVDRRWPMPPWWLEIDKDGFDR